MQLTNSPPCRSSWELPEYRVEEFKAPSNSYCLVIPVIDEGQKFVKQLAQIHDKAFPVDVVVADGGSVDGSTESSGLKDSGVSALLVKTGQGKLSAQLRMAFAYCLLKGYDGIITIDGNGKDGIDAIPLFIDGLKEGFDYLQGSRFIAGGEAINTPLDRLIGLKFLHAPLISLAAGYRYTDTTNGFRAFSKRFLSDERVQPFRNVFDTYNLHYYLSVRAGQLGFKIKEVPVTRCYPQSSKVPTKIAGFSGKAHILRQLLAAVTGRYDPTI